MVKDRLSEALFWHKERNGIRCELCSWRCFIGKGKLGFCEVRKNVDNKLYSLNYAKVVSFGLSGIENNPLFHFYPGSKTFFIHTVGSSFKLDFKNIGGREKEVDVGRMSNEIKKSGANSVTFGGGDPAVEMEYVLELMKANKKNGVANAFVTNGYIANDINKKINKFIDAVTVEIYASLDKEFYKSHCAVNDIEPIKIFMKKMKKHGIHMEVSNAVISQVGDKMEAFKKLVEFVTSDIDSYTPLHLVQIKAEGKFSHLPKMSQSAMERFYEEAKNGGMRNVFVPGMAGREDTICYNCNQVVIKRENRVVKKNSLEGDRCTSCGLRINVINK